MALKATLVMVGILSVWMAVQAGWRRVFSESRTGPDGLPLGSTDGPQIGSTDGPQIGSTDGSPNGFTDVDIGWNCQGCQRERDCSQSSAV